MNTDYIIDKALKRVQDLKIERLNKARKWVSETFGEGIEVIYNEELKEITCIIGHYTFFVRDNDCFSSGFFLNYSNAFDIEGTMISFYFPIRNLTDLGTYVIRIRKKESEIKKKAAEPSEVVIHKSKKTNALTRFFCNIFLL